MEEMTLKIRRSTKEDLKQFEDESKNSRFIRGQIKNAEYFIHIEMDGVIMNVPPHLCISQIIGALKESKNEL